MSEREQARKLVKEQRDYASRFDTPMSWPRRVAELADTLEAALDREERLREGVLGAHVDLARLRVRLPSRPTQLRELAARADAQLAAALSSPAEPDREQG